ncbi:MAG: NAD(P)/FAD-dependent oxidoreductase [Clostridiales bacterium]|nr:NAD(P)/FAD-dependent oxidoreductase [Clostridiales bacterium]
MGYERLFSEGKIGNLTLKNRVVMSPMGLNFANASGEASDCLIDFYTERAKGGVGLIYTEICCVDEEHGKGSAANLRANDFRYIPSLQRMVDSVHKYGTKMILQLQHPGRQGVPRFNNGYVVAPSAIKVKSPLIQHTPKELTVDEIHDLVGKFVTGAMIARAAGFDGVDLHAAHGYLINQFISPDSNRRTDEYGGSFENRMRFITEIVQGIQKACGRNFPITVRLTADEMTETGYDLEYGVRIALYLESIGIAALNVSNGTYESDIYIIESRSYGPGWKKRLGRTIKEAVSIPVIAVDVIKKPDFAEQMLEEGNCDFVGLGRQLLCDPEWVNKSASGQEEDIRPCISCIHCLSQVATGKCVRCTMNVRLGREAELTEWPEAKNNGTVAIVGGGPAGCEAARVLASRGYKVVLFEKNGELGGTVNLAKLPPHQEMLQDITDYYTVQLKKLGVDVRLNTEATLEQLQTLNPYATIIAIGAETATPPIDGIHNSNVYLYDEILTGRVSLEGKKVAVIGGGATGCETAQLLSEAGNEVQIIELADGICAGEFSQLVSDTWNELKKCHVDVLLSHKVVKFTEGGVVTQADGQEKLIPADAVVVCLGSKINGKKVAELKEAVNNSYVIGDAAKVGKITEAVRAGFELGYTL